MGYMPNYKINTETKNYKPYNSGMDKMVSRLKGLFTGRIDRHGAKVAYEMYKDLTPFIIKLIGYFGLWRDYDDEPYRLTYAVRTKQEYVHLRDNVLLLKDSGYLKNPYRLTSLRSGDIDSIFKSKQIQLFQVPNGDKGYQPKNIKELFTGVKYITEEEVNRQIGNNRKVFKTYDMSRVEEYGLIVGYMHLIYFHQYLEAVYMGQEDPDLLLQLVTNQDFVDYIVKLNRVASSEGAFYALIEQDNKYHELFFAPVLAISKEFEAIKGSVLRDNKQSKQGSNIDDLEELQQIMNWSSTRLMPVEGLKLPDIDLDNLNLDSFD